MAPAVEGEVQDLYACIRGKSVGRGDKNCVGGELNASVPDDFGLTAGLLISLNSKKSTPSAETTS